MNKTIRFLILIPVSAATLFVVYPVLHEFGHAVMTWILGGRVSSFAFTPLPHIESGLPFDAPGKVAAVSIAGMLFPPLLCFPFRKLRGYRGYTVMLMLLLSAITSAVELCIAIQYQLGDIMTGDDIVLFLSASGLDPVWTYMYCGLICFASLAAAICMQPLQLLSELASGSK